MTAGRSDSQPDARRTIHWLDAAWYERRRRGPAWPESCLHRRDSPMARRGVRFPRQRDGRTAGRWRIEPRRLVPVLVHAVDDLPALPPAPKDLQEWLGLARPVQLAPARDERSGFYASPRAARADGSRSSSITSSLWPTAATRSETHPVCCSTAPDGYNDWARRQPLSGIDGPQPESGRADRQPRRPLDAGSSGCPRARPDLRRPPPSWDRAALSHKDGACQRLWLYYAPPAGPVRPHFVQWPSARANAPTSSRRPTCIFRGDPRRLACVRDHRPWRILSHEMRANPIVIDGAARSRASAPISAGRSARNEGRRRSVYKFRAATRIRARHQDDHRLTPLEDPAGRRPGASTFGVNGFRGLYAPGAAHPRGQRGFTVYRRRLGVPTNRSLLRRHLAREARSTLTRSRLHYTSATAALPDRRGRRVHRIESRHGAACAGRGRHEGEGFAITSRQRPQGHRQDS